MNIHSLVGEGVHVARLTVRGKVYRVEARVARRDTGPAAAELTIYDEHDLALMCDVTGVDFGPPEAPVRLRIADDLCSPRWPWPKATLLGPGAAIRWDRAPSPHGAPAP